MENDRQKAEREALRELAKEPPLSPEESRRLLEKRKQEFDRAWSIDPNTPTDYSKPL